MRRPSIGSVRVALVLTLALSSCTPPAAPDAAQESASAQSGITGTLTAVGGRIDTPDRPTAGQVQIWLTVDVSRPTSTLAGGRPLEAVDVLGAFVVELEPGRYFVRATEAGGLICGEATIEVKPGSLEVLDFVCERR